MKRSIPIAFVLCAVCPVSFAVILFSIGAPQDDSKVRSGVGDRPELKPLHAAYTNIIQTRLWPLKLDEVPRICGPKLDTATNWWALGVEGSGPKLNHHPANLVFAHLRSGRREQLRREYDDDGLWCAYWGPGEDKSHTDLYAIGDIGYVEFYSQLDGENVQTAVIYFRADNKFVPLKSTNDFPKRWNGIRPSWRHSEHRSTRTLFQSKIPRDFLQMRRPNPRSKGPNFCYSNAPITSRFQSGALGGASLSVFVRQSEPSTTKGKPMTRRPTTLTAAAGEHYVTYQLSSQNCIVAFPRGACPQWIFSSAHSQGARRSPSRLKPQLGMA